ncbi:MAG: SLC13 family permease [Sulfolobales archaeon]
MSYLQILSITIFILTVSLIVSRKLEESHAGLIGASLILILGVMDLYEAFGHYVDWNIISILLGMWMLSFFLTDSGAVEFIVHRISRSIKSVFGIVFVMNFLAGIVTMFVDNVLVVLLFVPLILKLAKEFGFDPVRSGIMVALSANFMGTALLLGDLPPQLLHVVFGAEFPDFIWMMNRPSSFIVLSLTFIPTLIIVSKILLRETGKTLPRERFMEESISRVDKIYVIIALISFLTVIALMSLRKTISDLVGYNIRLGVFPLLVASVTAVILVSLRKTSFEKVVDEGIDLNAILFYITLFILVGSLEKTGVLDIIAGALAPATATISLGYTLIYWVSAAISSVVEHDAYILVMLKTLKLLYDNGSLHNPWPFNWALLWAGTLGSNFTAAGAPALYVAFRLIEKDLGRKILPKEIYRVTVLYTLVSLGICYLISYMIWVAY